MQKSFVLLLFLLSSSQLFSQTIGVEFSYKGSSNSIDLPGLLQGTFDKVESGSGSNLSFGLNIKASDNISVSGGLTFWNIPFIPTIKGTSNNQSIFTKEIGSLSYTGIYLRVERNWQYFYFGGGFDISVSNSYKSTLETRNASGVLISKSDNGNKSILTNEFNQQFNLVLGLGPRIPIGKSFAVKGLLGVVVPFSSIYDTGVSVPQIYLRTGAPAPDAKINLRYLPFLTYGITVEYRFGNKD